MKNSAKVIFGFILSVTQANAEVLDVFGPFTYPASGSAFSNVMLAVPESIVGNCIENSGEGAVKTNFYQRLKNIHGKYSDVYGDELKGDRIYYKNFSCTYPFLTLAEMLESPFRDALLGMDQLGHSYYDHGKGINPNFSNPDRDSTRHLTQVIGKLYFNPDTFAGPNASAALYSGSPFGRDAYYQRIQVICDGRYEKKPITDLNKLDLECPDEFIGQEAKKYMDGPTTVMFLQIDSPYFNGLFVDGL